MSSVFRKPMEVNVIWVFSARSVMVSLGRGRSSTIGRVVAVLLLCTHRLRGRFASLSSLALVSGRIHLITRRGARGSLQVGNVRVGPRAPILQQKTELRVIRDHGLGADVRA
eukprot:7505293-Pyramimonas_sp.AAC.1